MESVSKLVKGLNEQVKKLVLIFKESSLINKVNMLYPHLLILNCGLRKLQGP